MFTLQKDFVLLVWGDPVVNVYVHLGHSFHERHKLHVRTMLDMACELHMRHEETFGRYC